MSLSGIDGYALTLVRGSPLLASACWCRLLLLFASFPSRVDRSLIDPMGDFDRVFCWISAVPEPLTGLATAVGVVAPESNCGPKELAEDVRRVDGLRGPIGGRVGDTTLARLEVEAEGPGDELATDEEPLKVEVEPDMEGWM